MVQIRSITNPVRSNLLLRNREVRYFLPMMPQVAPDISLCTRLLEGLARFKMVQSADAVAHAENLFAYCAFRTERLAQISAPEPVLGVVISGAKEVWQGSTRTVLAAGSVFVLPARTEMDILNIPDDRTGIYQSLIVRIDQEALRAVRRSMPESSQRTCGAVSPKVRLTPHLVHAVIHAASSIIDGIGRSLIRSSRLLELLALLRDDPAAHPLFEQSVGERIAQLVRTDLSKRWTARLVAQAMAMSESTLRRRLAEESCSFSQLLRHERMLEARRLLNDGAIVQSASLAVGYASRTHFARHFKAAFGSNPARVRAEDKIGPSAQNGRLS